MKVVHVSNFTMKWDAINYWSIPYKLTNGLIRQGHHVVNVSDRDIADAYFLGIRQMGAGHVNRKLLRICREVRPDLLILGLATLIEPETLVAIREILPSVRIAHWNCDPLFQPRNLARLRALAPIVDATFVTTAGEQLSWVSQAGGRAYFMPNPIDRAIESRRVFEHDVENDLVFISNPQPERERFARRIMAEIPELKFDIHGILGRPGVYGTQMIEALCRARMGLNLSRRSDVFLYSSNRMSLLVGNGLLTFIDRNTGFDTIFSDDELPFYDCDDELVEKIRHFKRHDEDARKLAQRGWQRIHEAFATELVAKYIVELSFGETCSQAYAWPMA